MALKLTSVFLVMILCATFIVDINAYPTGAPARACADARPVHTEDGNVTQPLSPADNPYTFTVNVQEYIPGGTLQVTIANSSGGMVNGFFLQARRNDTDDIVGTFQGPLPNRTQFRECTNAADSVTHTDKNGKTGLTFTWQAPPAGAGSIYFVGAVAISHDDFYAGIRSPLLQESDMTVAPTTPTMTTADGVKASVGFGVLFLALFITSAMLFK